tara:strand:- start:55 stop:414 length:360 start_codon:yes stop_codon:yes gene_type:complete
MVDGTGCCRFDLHLSDRNIRNNLKALDDFKSVALSLLDMLGPGGAGEGAGAGCAQPGSAWAMFILGPLLMDKARCKSIGITGPTPPANSLGFVTELKDFAVEAEGSCLQGGSTYGQGSL